MTLIADPLYNPFQRFPKLSVFDLPPQLGDWKRAEGPEPPPPPPMIPMEPEGEEESP
jgi:hypothetical protein